MLFQHLHWWSLYKGIFVLRLVFRPVLSVGHPSGCADGCTGRVPKNVKRWSVVRWLPTHRRMYFRQRATHLPGCPTGSFRQPLLFRKDLVRPILHLRGQSRICRCSRCGKAWYSWRPALWNGLCFECLYLWHNRFPDPAWLLSCRHLSLPILPVKSGRCSFCRG